MPPGVTLRLRQLADSINVKERIFLVPNGSRRRRGSLATDFCLFGFAGGITVFATSILFATKAESLTSEHQNFLEYGGYTDFPTLELLATKRHHCICNIKSSWNMADTLAYQH